MTVVKKNDSFTYYSAHGDLDVARPADIVGIVNPDGSTISSQLASELDSAKDVELLRAIDVKLGALLILMSNAFAPGDKPEAYLDAAEIGLRSTSN